MRSPRLAVRDGIIWRSTKSSSADSESASVAAVTFAGATAAGSLVLGCATVAGGHRSRSCGDSFCRTWRGRAGVSLGWRRGFERIAHLCHSGDELRANVRNLFINAFSRQPLHHDCGHVMLEHETINPTHHHNDVENDDQRRHRPSETKAAV